MNSRPREYLLSFEAGDTEQQFRPTAPFRAFVVRIGRRAYPQTPAPAPYNAPAGPWLASTYVNAWVSSVMIAGQELLVVPNGIPVEAFRMHAQSIIFPAQQVGSAFKVTLTEPAREAFALTVCGQEVP